MSNWYNPSAGTVGIFLPLWAAGIRIKLEQLIYAFTVATGILLTLLHWYTHFAEAAGILLPPAAAGILYAEATDIHLSLEHLV